MGIPIFSGSRVLHRSTTVETAPEETVPATTGPEPTRRSEGGGIGLAIVKEIITRHHGSIIAENGEKGLRMTISMPMLDRNLTKS